MASNIEELKNRLEILPGVKPDAAVDESMKTLARQQAVEIENGMRMAKAGGQLLGAAVAFIGEMFPEREETEITGPRDPGIRRSVQFRSIETTLWRCKGLHFCRARP